MLAATAGPLLPLTFCFFLVLRGTLLPPLRLLSPTCSAAETGWQVSSQK